MGTLNPDRAPTRPRLLCYHYVEPYNKADDETHNVLPLAHI